MRELKRYQRYLSTMKGGLVAIKGIWKVIKGVLRATEMRVSEHYKAE